MDLIRNESPELAPELMSLQEKALDFAIERGRDDLDLRRKVTYFCMCLIGLAFVLLAVLLIFPLSGGAPPPPYVIGAFTAATVTGAAYKLGKVVSSLSGGGRPGGDSLMVMGRSALSNIRRAMGARPDGR